MSFDEQPTVPQGAAPELGQDTELILMDAGLDWDEISAMRATGSARLMDLQLVGKRALVTGSSSGIGTGIAKVLAAEGASVVVHGRNAERTERVRAELEASGATGGLDARRPRHRRGRRGRSPTPRSRAFGGIDILVNNAGGGADLPNPSWFSTDLAVVARHLPEERDGGRPPDPPPHARHEGAGLGPHHPDRQHGRHGADLGPARLRGREGSDAGDGARLSKALKGSGVTVNTVTPGMIWTEGLEDFLRKFAAKRGWDDIQQAADYILKGTGQTVLRIGQPEDIANAVAYLASPVADFVNGVNMHLDGGGTANIY